MQRSLVCVDASIIISLVTSAGLDEKKNHQIDDLPASICMKTIHPPCMIFITSSPAL